MVGGEHGRAVTRQALAMAYRQADRHQDHRPHHDREEDEAQASGEQVPAHGARLMA